MNNLSKYIYIFILCVVFCACEKNIEQPKPPTYLRLEVNKPSYITFDNEKLPFVFDYDKEAKIEFLQSKDKNMQWFNIDEKQYNFEIN
ncbi:MAG: hypothetical protein Q4Q06_05200, partial [Bacteroidota bacterium]|nr:hypothetical protein [Bacteroidota bacterium]